MEINEILHGTENALIVARRDDLIEFATTYADRILSRQPKPATKQDPEAPISQNEAMLFVKKSRQTFHSWRKKGIIKAHILGGRVYYFKSELISAMK